MYRDYTQNRELSWLKFNERVLMEAVDETVPLLERLRFIAIFTSNLDEFFMIRVGSLSELMRLKESSVDNKSGMSPEEQLKAIYKEVRRLYEKREKIYQDLKRELRIHGICNLSYRETDSADRKFLKKYFFEYVQPILSPQIVDEHHPFPHLQNKTVHIGVRLSVKGRDVFAFIPLPAVLPPVLYLDEDEARYIRMEEVVSAYAEDIFASYEVKEKICFCVTRNADINAEDEEFDFGYDFRKKMKKVLKERRRLAAVRLELSGEISKGFQAYLSDKLNVSQEQIYVTSLQFKMSYVFSVGAHLSPEKVCALSYPDYVPQANPLIDLSRSIISQVEKKDLVLSLPYESLQPFVLLLKEASEDPAVISVKITIYRLASNAKVVDYLCNAAENGKDVTVIIELRARFDEQNNIDWPERLEEAGCNVIYGLEGYKVHSKICLITRREKNGIRYITQIGTGNYNEKTACQYTDLSLITADPGIGMDAVRFFHNIAIGDLAGSYEHLLAAPNSLKNHIIACIDEEIVKGNEGRILLKLNSITDLDIIERLKQASCAGVQIQMIVRGICCILPGVAGKTENICVKSIVGRFLEHARVYCFGSGDSEKMFISSADFMTRNTERRVEVACPVFDREAKEKIHRILDACLADNTKSRILGSDSCYRMVPVSEDGKRVDCQQKLMQDAVRAAAERKQKTGERRPVIRRFLSALFARDAI